MTSDSLPAAAAGGIFPGMAINVGGTTRPQGNIMTGLLGVPPRLPVAELLREAHAWGQTSEAIFRALSPAAREIVLKPRAQLSPAQRQFSERVDTARVDGALRDYVRSIKVLKRPG